MPRFVAAFSGSEPPSPPFAPSVPSGLSAAPPASCLNLARFFASSIFALRSSASARSLFNTYVSVVFAASVLIARKRAFISFTVIVFKLLSIFLELLGF